MYFLENKGDKEYSKNETCALRGNTWREDCLGTAMTPPPPSPQENGKREEIKAEEDWHKHRNCESVRSFNGNAEFFRKKPGFLNSVVTK